MTTQAQRIINEFFDYFYTHNLWEYKTSETHPSLGQIDVYQLKQHPSSHIISEKNYQIEHAYRGTHNHASHQVLPAYRVEYANGFPKWLPHTVGVKTIKGISTHGAENLKNQIEGNLERYWKYHPEIINVFGYQQVGDDFKVYVELQGTLEQDILQRRAENRPYQEELLWKMLYSLVRASYKLNASGQQLNDIRPSRVYYNSYQLSVIPYGISYDKDLGIHHKFLSGENIWYHEDIINDFHNHSSLEQAAVQRAQFTNEAFQIGMTVLAAGLLKTESELNVCANKAFNRSSLEKLLDDFGTIYSSQNRLLQFTLEELFLKGTRQNPTEVWRLFERETDHFIFLEEDLQHHLVHQYATSQYISSRRSAFQSNFPLVYPSTDFKRAYHHHFHYELCKLDYETRLVELETHNSNIRVQLGSSVIPSESVKHTHIHHNIPYETVKHSVRASQHHHHHGGEVVRTYISSSPSQEIRESVKHSHIHQSPTRVIRESSPRVIRESVRQSNLVNQSGVIVRESQQLSSSQIRGSNVIRTYTTTNN